MPTIFRPAHVAALLGLSSLLIVGCSDNTVTPATVDHFKADGLVLVRRGSDSVIVDSTRVTGSLEVGASDTTGYFDVFFLHGTSRTREVPDDAVHTLWYTIGDSTLLSIETPPHLDGHTHEHYEFRLRGKKAGTTTLAIHLRHGDHDDYLSPEIGVKVGP